MDRETWESLCHRCGKCCFEKIEEDDGALFMTDEPCRYLDVVTRMCKIYDRRLELCPDCLPIEPDNMERYYWLPDDCGYVRYYLGEGNDWPPEKAEKIVHKE